METEKKINVQIQINSLDSDIERFIKKNLNLEPPESYGKMDLD